MTMTVIYDRYVIVYDIILNSNSKFKNKKINKIENRNKKRNKNS